MLFIMNFSTVAKNLEFLSTLSLLHTILHQAEFTLEYFRTNQTGWQISKGWERLLPTWTRTWVGRSCCLWWRPPHDLLNWFNTEVRPREETLSFGKEVSVFEEKNISCLDVFGEKLLSFIPSLVELVDF